MKQTFLLNLVLLVGINILIKPLYAFGIDLQVQNQVGVSDYGLYFALFNFSYLFQIVSDFGLQQYNNRLIAQQPQLVNKYLPHFLQLKAFLALAFILFSGIAALLMGYGLAEAHLLLFLLFNQILITLIFFLRSNISGLQFYKLDSILSSVDKILMLLIMPFLLWGPWQKGFCIEWFVYAQTASFICTAFLVIAILYLKIKEPLRFYWKPALLWSILRQCYPYAMVVFLMMAYTRVDAVMLERMLGAEEGRAEAGVYAFGYRLLDAFNMIGYLFASLLLPMFARMLQQKESITDLLQTAFQWMVFLTLNLSISVFFYADDITQWIFVAYTPYTAEVLRLLLWSSTAVGIIYVFGTLLTANANTRRMNQIFLLGIILNVLMNLILIPSHGAWGAALATLCTQGFVALAEMRLGIKLLAKDFSKSLLFKSLVLVLLLLMVYAGAYYGLGPYVDWRLGLVSAGIVGLILAERIGFLELKGILKIIRSKQL